MKPAAAHSPWFAAVAGAALCALMVPGCGQQLDVGSDLLWTARFEGNNLGEWTAVLGGGESTAPSSNTLATSNEFAHKSTYAAKMVITTPSDGSQAGANLVRNGNLPVEAYYSAWYYLPQSVSVGTYWVIMKFRMRTDINDASTETELYDIDLRNPSSGQMSLRIYDHRDGDLTLSVTDPVVPVGNWFQLEAFYRNADDNTGRLVLWLDGKEIANIVKPTGPAGWTAWDVGSIGVNLTPAAVTLFIDDCAISHTRVGLGGLLAM
jgi:hypothetical protein